jgi:Skp family chaperone for outer membrane proteins
VRAAVTLFVALAILPAQAPSPAAAPVGADCATYAATHVLVRKDVFVRMDAAEQNLAKAEAALKQAQVDLQAMKAAAEELQRQKALLQEHVGLLDGSLRSCIDSRHEDAGEVVDAVQRAAGAAWEAVDAPLGFAAGAGMCVGIAWSLSQATR